MDLITSYYLKFTKIWSSLCKLHAELLDLSYDEFQAIKKSELERIIEITSHKDEIVSKIDKVDKARKFLIQNFSETIPEVGIFEKSHELIAFFKNNRVNEGIDHLDHFNNLLIEVIENLQDQNRKNQYFLNRAINSLEQLKADMTGSRKYNHYNAKGLRTAHMK
jgi:flagellar biosynthesis/type III secretory pathway chaperone